MSRDYRVPAGVELLDRQRIEEGLQPSARALLAELVVADVLDSTNAEVLRRMKEGAGSGLVCVAEQQTAGRGRRGRNWVSPLASNIYLSLSWEFAGEPAKLEGLSLAVGVAVAEALRSAGVPGIGLKWPNDVLAGGAKLGGILVEMIAGADNTCRVVVGIGLNVNMPQHAIAEIDQSWTDVKTAMGGDVSRNALLISLLDQLLPLLDGFEVGGFTPWRERWCGLDAFAGREVIVTSGEQSTAGIARGIDQSGALVLETALGSQVFHGGEVSVRIVQ